MTFETKALGFGLVLEELLRTEKIAKDGSGELSYERQPLTTDQLKYIARKIINLYELPHNEIPPFETFGNVNRIISYFDQKIYDNYNDNMEHDIELTLEDIYPSIISEAA